jgi:hypothetical protein
MLAWRLGHMRPHQDRAESSGKLESVQQLAYSPCAAFADSVSNAERPANVTLLRGNRRDTRCQSENRTYVAVNTGSRPTLCFLRRESVADNLITLRGYRRPGGLASYSLRCLSLWSMLDCP